MKLSAKTLAIPTSFIAIGDNGRGWIDHRAQAIRMACEYELVLTEMSLEWMKEKNPALDLSQARSEFFEEGPISSLKKIADFAFFAGIVGPRTRHDLRKFATLRDRYAHDRQRKQLDEDPDMLNLVKQTYTYKENSDALRNSEPYAIFVRVFWQIHECLVLRHVE